VRPYLFHSIKLHPIPHQPGACTLGYLIDGVQSAGIEIVVQPIIRWRDRRMTGSGHAENKEYWPHPARFTSVTRIKSVFRAIPSRPSRPGEFHPEPLTDPDLTLSRLVQWAWTSETVFEKLTILSKVSILDLLAGMRKGNSVLLANRRFQCCPV
jgi:hypothetical protein